MIFKKQISDNIEMIDVAIGEVVLEISDSDSGDDITELLDKLDRLNKIRSEMTDSRAKESSKSLVVSGITQLAGILLVLQYEKADVVTSSAFSMATKIFKRG